jgi:hypothetical protein
MLVKLTLGILERWFHQDQVFYFVEQILVYKCWRLRTTEFEFQCWLLTSILVRFHCCVFDIVTLQKLFLKFFSWKKVRLFFDGCCSSEMSIILQMFRTLPLGLGSNICNFSPRVRPLPQYFFPHNKKIKRHFNNFIVN